MRNLLARVCVDALEPDLVILDEFQRFRDLLDGESEAAELARSLMSCTTPEGNDVRVLLLSATPYKPVTLSGDEEDHYADFLRTLGFLFDDKATVDRLEESLRDYRKGLFEPGDPDLPKARRNVERLLRSVMVRTERVGGRQRRDAMLVTRALTAAVKADDLDQARMLHDVAEGLGADDTVEYWKSAPHLLNFMKDYQLKRKLEEAAADPPAPLAEVFRERQDGRLFHRDVDRYGDVAIANGRLRELLEDDGGAGPVAAPLDAAVAALPASPVAPTRTVPRLHQGALFSSWTVVPDAISALCSYEVERRMIEGGRSRSATATSTAPAGRCSASPRGRGG